MRSFVILVLTELFWKGYNFEKAVVHSKIGDTTTLRCPIRSQNISDVQWIRLHTKIVYSIGTKINPNIDNRTEGNKFEIVGNHDIGEYNLKIINITSKDNGVYRCDTEINGKPGSRFIQLVVDVLDYYTDIATNKYTKDVRFRRTKGFSIYNWILIFIFAILGILSLPLVVAVVFKTMRSNFGQNQTDNNINVERETEISNETINDIVVASSQISALYTSDTNRSRLAVQTLEIEWSFAHRSSANVDQCISPILHTPEKEPDMLLRNRNQDNECNTDANYETSSAYSSGTSIALVYEAPYLNHYHPLVSNLEHASHVYDECMVERIIANVP